MQLKISSSRPCFPNGRPSNRQTDILMPEQIAISTETWDLLKTPSTATLTTVLAKKGLWNTFLTGVKPLVAGQRMAAAADGLVARHLPIWLEAVLQA